MTATATQTAEVVGEVARYADRDIINVRCKDGRFAWVMDFRTGTYHVKRLGAETHHVVTAGTDRFGARKGVLRAVTCDCPAKKYHPSRPCVHTAAVDAVLAAW